MDQAYRILTSVGLQVQYKNDYLKEILPEQETSYQLKNTNDKWEYVEVDCKNKIMNRMEFSTEAEGIKYFVLNRLYSFYLKKYKKVSPLMDEITSFSEFADGMKKLGIKEEYYSFSTVKPQSFLGTLAENMVTISYINQKKNIGFVSPSLDFDKGLHTLFNYVYLLYSLKVLERKLLDEQVIDKPFTDDYIANFVK